MVPSALFVATILSVLTWRIHKKQGIYQAPYWALVAFGFFFYTVSGVFDVFTPVFGTGFGLHNYIVELTLSISLAMIFIGLRRIMRTFA